MTNKINTLLLGLYFIVFCACTCIGSDAIESNIDEVDIVAKGTVVSQKKVNISTFLNAEENKGKSVTFEMESFYYSNNEMIELIIDIETYYKTGNTCNLLKFYTAIDSDACGYEFQIGEKYIVFLEKNKKPTFNGFEELFSTNKCRPNQIANVSIETKIINTFKD